jgi:hypothetical protein
MERMKAFVVHDILNNPLNLGILIFLGYITFKTLQPKAKPIPRKEPKIIKQRNFTPLELSAFDGNSGPDIYLAVAGKVFDVSSKPDFYGPGK